MLLKKTHTQNNVSLASCDSPSLISWTGFVCRFWLYCSECHKHASRSCKGTNTTSSQCKQASSTAKKDENNTPRWTHTYTQSPGIACMHGGRRLPKLRHHTTLFITSLTPGKYHNTVWVRTTTPPLSPPLCQQLQCRHRVKHMSSSNSISCQPNRHTVSLIWEQTGL